MSISSKFPKNTFRAWRAAVQRQIPILAPILYACTWKEDDNPPDVAGVCARYTFSIRPDLMEITYSPKTTSKLPEEENNFGVAHEAGHYLCDHMPRRLAMKKKEGTVFEPELWMMAEEMAVNQLVSTLSGWTIPPNLVKPLPGTENLSTEEIYYKLKEMPKQKMPQKCIHVCIHPDAEQDAKDGKGKNPANELMKVQVSEGAAKAIEEMIKNGGLQPGSMPGELREVAARFAKLKRPPDWREMLKRHLIATDFNCKYFDPSQLYRRMLPLCLPNLSSQPTAKKFVVSIDNSGSVSDEMFTKLCGVISSVAQQLGFQEIIVQHFTSVVMVTEKVHSMKQVEKIKRRADGGTQLEDCDAKAAHHRGQFHLILTDGYVNWLERYSLPTIIVRTVKDTQKPYQGRNLLADIVVDASTEFGD